MKQVLAVYIWGAFNGAVALALLMGALPFSFLSGALVTVIVVVNAGAVLAAGSASTTKGSG